MNINIPKEPLFIINTLEEKGFKGYLVGGCVRDSVMGLQANDYDIASDALPETVIDIFRSLGYTVVETGLKNGTITIVLGSDKLSHYEVTTFREDVYNPDGELDHRHPEDVQFSKDILVDLSRRDFTINAMAVDKFGNLLDPHNGLQDIKNGIIRCVGDQIGRAHV